VRRPAAGTCTAGAQLLSARAAKSPLQAAISSQHPKPPSRRAASRWRRCSWWRTWCVRASAPASQRWWVAARLSLKGGRGGGWFAAYIRLAPCCWGGGWRPMHTGSALCTPAAPYAAPVALSPRSSAD
jgi:hypothetical protein